MKGSKILAAAAAFLIVGMSGPAFATDRIEDGRNLAQELTEHPEPAVRAAALITLGHAGTRDQRALLETFQGTDRRAEERLSAGLGLILSGDSAATAYTASQIREASRTYDELRNVGAILPDDRMQALIIAILDDADQAVRRDVYRYLAGQTGDLYAYLAVQLTNSDADVRDIARRAIVHTARAGTLDVARTLAGHRTADIRRQVLDITERLGGRADLRSDVIEILTGLLDDSDRQIQIGAARQLVELGEQRGTNYLVSSLAGDESRERIETAQFLLEYDVRADLDALRPLIEEVEADTEADRQQERELLYELAATSRDGEFYQELRTLFRSNIFENRLVAARSLGRAGREEATDLLHDGLREGQSIIRLLSARSLGHLGHADSLNHLRRVVTGDRDKDVRLAAIEAIGRIDDERSVQVLRFFVNDNDSDIKLAIVDALANIGLPETASSLEILLRDRDLGVQWQAFLALMRVHPENVQRHISAALRNPPDGFEHDLDPYRMTTAVREAVYQRLLSHSGSRVRSSAVNQVEVHRDVLLPIARQQLLSDDIHRDVRRDLVHILISEGDDEDLVRLDRIMRNFAGEAAGPLAGWTLARVASSSFEASFRGFLASDNGLMRAISAYALTQMD